MNLKPCPKCGETKKLSRYMDENSYWIECSSCGFRGVGGISEEHADQLWDIFFRKEDRNQYAMRIRVKLDTKALYGEKHESLDDGEGWIIGFQNACGGETKAIVLRDDGKLKAIALGNITVDN